MQLVGMSMTLQYKAPQSTMSMVIGRALSCEATREDPSAPALAPRVMSLDAGGQSETRTRHSRDTKQRLHTAKTAVVRFFSRDKEVVDVQPPNEPGRTEALPISTPRTSAMPSSIVRSRKEAAPALKLTNDRPSVPRSQRISFAPVAVTRDNSQEATTAFFGSSEAQAPTGEQSRVVSLDYAPADEKASVALGTVRLRDEQIRRLRAISQEQQRVLETNRKLVTKYISRHREAREESSEWQSQCDKALELADHWRLEAEKQAKGANNLQHEVGVVLERSRLRAQELSAARERCDVLEEEKASALCELAFMRHDIGLFTGQKQDCLNVLQLAQNDCRVLGSEKEMLLKQMQETLGAFHLIQGECKALENEKGRLTESLETTRRDYELLVNHKTARYIADPLLQDPFSVKPDEVRSLTQAFEQSKRNHDRERQLHNQTFDRAQQHKSEVARDHNENILLHEKVEQLEELIMRKNNADAHLGAVRDLFAAGKLASSGSELAKSIEELAEEIVAEKVSIESLAKLMPENADLKQALNESRLQHKDEIAAARTEIEADGQNFCKHDLDHLKHDLKLETTQQGLDAAVERIKGLTEERDYWRTQCARPLHEKEQTLFGTMENRFAFNKHMASDQQSQIEALEWDLVMLRSWALEEVANTGIYLDQRDWHKAQVDALEAQFPRQMEELPLKMHFRSVWKALSEEEREELRQVEINGDDHRYIAYSTVREAYLNALPSDYEVLTEQVAREATTVREWQAAKTRRTGNHSRAPAGEPASPATWGPVLAQLPPIVPKKDQGQDSDVKEMDKEKRKTSLRQELVEPGVGSRGSWETVDGALEG